MCRAMERKYSYSPARPVRYAGKDHKEPPTKMMKTKIELETCWTIQLKRRPMNSGVDTDFN